MVDDPRIVARLVSIDPRMIQAHVPTSKFKKGKYLSVSRAEVSSQASLTVTPLHSNRYINMH